MTTSHRTRCGLSAAPLLSAALLLLACEPPSLAPSLDLSGDALVVSMPGDTTLLVGVDLDQVQREAGFTPWRACIDHEVDTALRDLERRTGLVVTRDTFVSLRLACGGQGCALAAQGDLPIGFIAALGEAVDPGGRSVTWWGTPDHVEPRGFDAELPGGDPVRARLRSDQLLIAGDPDAVDVVLSARGPLPPFDVAPLRGRVPYGQLWAVAFDAEHLFEQAARRLDGRGSLFDDALATRLRAARGPHRVAAELVEVVALSVELSDPARLRLRVTCRSPLAARQVTLLLRAALSAERLRARLGVGLLSSLERAEVIRVGEVVEATLALPRCGDL